MTDRYRLIGCIPAGRMLLVPIGLAVALLWAYRPILAAMADRWTYDPRYAHGYLVPAFALVLLWLRRDRLAKAGEERRLRPSWWGVAPIAAGCLIRLAGAYIYNDWLDAVSLLPCLAGICVLLGGWGTLGWAWPSLAFLAFMIPLPYRLELALGWPLQRVATIASTYALQTIGLPAIGEGNVIQMGRSRIGVVEACSGLSMMILFFALSTGAAIVSRRPLLDRLVLIASAVPIALIANIARITATGILHETVGERIANVVFHDLAGWLMMPLALLLMSIELWLLARLLVEVGPAPAVAVPVASAAGLFSPHRDGPGRRDRRDRPGPIAPIPTRPH